MSIRLLFEIVVWAASVAYALYYATLAVQALRRQTTDDEAPDVEVTQRLARSQDPVLEAWEAAGFDRDWVGQTLSLPQIAPDGTLAPDAGVDLIEASRNEENSFDFFFFDAPADAVVQYAHNYLAFLEAMLGLDPERGWKFYASDEASEKIRLWEHPPDPYYELYYPRLVVMAAGVERNTPFTRADGLRPDFALQTVTSRLEGEPDFSAGYALLREDPGPTRDWARALRSIITLHKAVLEAPSEEAALMVKRLLERNELLPSVRAQP